MAGRVAEVVAIAALATIVTAAIAAPVLRAPSERVFGKEIVGRHYDPFTVMEQFGRPIRVEMYSQPVTDITGALLARISGARDPTTCYSCRNSPDHILKWDGIIGGLIRIGAYRDCHHLDCLQDFNGRLIKDSRFALYNLETCRFKHLDHRRLGKKA